MARPPLRALEFYAGIGGMHCALDTCKTPGQVLAAFDINPLALDGEWQTA